MSKSTKKSGNFKYNREKASEYGKKSPTNFKYNREAARRAGRKSALARMQRKLDKHGTKEDASE